jgi:hypothetical protein
MHEVNKFMAHAIALELYTTACSPEIIIFPGDFEVKVQVKFSLLFIKIVNNKVLINCILIKFLGLSSLNLTIVCKLLKNLLEILNQIIISKKYGFSELFVINLNSIPIISNFDFPFNVNF